MRQHLSDRSAEPEPDRPIACPACKSPDITTASKAITAATYWRCVACGELWNVGRREVRDRSWPRYR